MVLVLLDPTRSLGVSSALSSLPCIYGWNLRVNHGYSEPEIMRYTSLKRSTLPHDSNRPTVGLSDFLATASRGEVARATPVQGNEVPDDKVAPPNEVGASLYTLPSSNSLTQGGEVPDDKSAPSNGDGWKYLPCRPRTSSPLN